MVKEELAEYLKQFHLGEENAIKSKDLKPLFGSGKYIRIMVNALRCDGVPICSGTSGYFYAKTRDEIEVTMALLESRIVNMRRAYVGLSKAFYTLPKG